MRCCSATGGTPSRSRATGTRRAREIVSFEPEELFGTKLRALLQRRKNRDLFDLHHGLTQLGLDRDKVVTCLNHYLALEDHPISRAEAEERMLKKLTRSLTEDIEPLLPVGVRFDEAVAIDAFNDVWSTLIARLRGDAWRLTADVVAQLRTKYPRLLTSARTEIVSFEPEELFGTKLRALLQRRKNRDLFDLHHGLTQLGLDRDKVVSCLNHYLALRRPSDQPSGS